MDRRRQHRQVRAGAWGCGVNSPVETRLKAWLAWCVSASGRKDIGALIALLTAIYTGLHRAGA